MKSHGQYIRIVCTLLLTVALSGLLSGASVFAQVITDQNPQLQKIDIIEHLGDTIPLDLTFTDDLGQVVRLGDYFHKGKPIILTLGYYRCPMLCNLVMNGLNKGVKQLEWTPGDQFQMVTISINPEETPELALAKKQTYIVEFGKPGLEQGWSFLVGKESQSQTIADAIGFKYFFDESRDEYAHAAAAFVLTEDGRISRYLYGIDFKERDLKLALIEASEGKIGSTFDRLILYCFHYDPDAQSYVLFAGNLMKIAGLLTVMIVGTFLAIFWIRERRKIQQQANTGIPIPEGSTITSKDRTIYG
ncbi:MAG: SCO family protein [candidate division Zixibacteria bacterium]|nr:SCO family protein [candidate division Zixibacteria bacterium]